jgi:hypothetical protein
MQRKPGLLAVATSLILAACGGGGGGAVDTEPRALTLVSGEGKGSMNGAEFVPTYGASRVFSDTGHVAIVIGSAVVSCAVVKGERNPPDGKFVELSLSDGEVGTPELHLYRFFSATGGDLDVGSGAGSNGGTAQVLSATTDTLEVAMAYSDTVEGVPYTIDGTFQLYRCP